MSDLDSALFERDTILRVTKITVTGIVAIVLTVATCVAAPWTPPKVPEKPEAEQCAALCGSRQVSKFVASHEFWRDGLRLAAPMTCECEGRAVTAP
jgi:hypothetical protein